MNCPKVIIVVEDRYAKEAIRKLLIKRQISCFDVQYLPICSTKFSRIISAHQDYGRHIIIVADAELENPTEKETQIRDKHGLHSNNVDIIIVDPCMEALACIALGLNGCRNKPCDAGPLFSVKEYYKNIHRKDYKKRFLEKLLLEADDKNNLEKVYEFKKLINKINKNYEN
ncbi:hypothetical protein PYJP_08150 [Pyrofollis japonicus]|uniref:hypothetical protein n=1 Tax=Pyrofollis japonicus TaxID=3060460 RepID=UPI00295A891E|nr:hypothetical protein [Pyrofollis japonicus]BEP17463.1 hypothetical protein PYJP_08150 [Pyrofollis japonicus]